MDILGGSNLITVNEVRDSAGLAKNTNISDEFITIYMLKACGDVWTYVSGRYSLKSFTRERFAGSMAYDFLKGCMMLLASSYLMNEGYGSQRLEEENGSRTKYEQQLAMLDDVRKGNTRLLDKNLDEFDLVPKSPNKTLPSGISSSFGSYEDKVFKVTDTR